MTIRVMTTRGRRPVGPAVVAVAAVLLALVPAHATASTDTCTDSGQGGLYGGGTGESDSPYEIATVAHLQALRDRVNGPSITASDGEDQSGCFFLQTADIDLSGIASWVAIGATSSDGFRGTYDGGYRRIDGLTITAITLTTGTMREGLFGYVRNGTIRNVRLYGVDIRLTLNDPARTSSLYVGALVANPESSSASDGTPQGVTRVERSSVEGAISVDFTGQGQLYVGGVVGRSQRGTLVNDRLVFRGIIDGRVDPRSTSTSVAWYNFGGLVGRTSSDSTLSIGYASAVMNVTVVPKPAGVTAPRPVYVGILAGSTSSIASQLSELYAVGSINVTNPGADTVYSGAIGFIEEPTDTLTDIYHLDSIVGGTTVSGVFTPNATYTFAGGQVDGYVSAGVTNVLARTDAQMRLDAPATTMTGSGGRWIYNNHPTAPDVNGKWYLVRVPAAGEYPYPVFFWEINDVPAGTAQFRLITRGDDSTPTAAPTGPSLACAPNDPPVGTTVTCDVTDAAPNIDILWRATVGDSVIASVGVRTGDDGTGTFSFVVPRSAVGQRLLVELVEWTRPLDVGVVGVPVPRTFPAGEGAPVSSALLVGLVAVAGAVLAMGRARRSVGVPTDA